MCMIFRILISVLVFEIPAFYMLQFPQVSFIDCQADMYGAVLKNLVKFWHFWQSSENYLTEICFSLSFYFFYISQPE